MGNTQAAEGDAGTNDTKVGKRWSLDGASGEQKAGEDTEAAGEDTGVAREDTGAGAAADETPASPSNARSPADGGDEPEEHVRRTVSSILAEMDFRAKDNALGPPRPCAVSVLDYGVTAGLQVCRLNGVDLGDAPIRPVMADGPAKLAEQFPPGFFTEVCTWERRVRWIDVEAPSREIVHLLLKIIGCDTRSSLNMLMDPQRRSMALELDSHSGINVLVMALKAKLTTEAAEAKQEGSQGQLYNLTHIMHHETTSYICRIEEGRNHTVLITLQSKMEDDIFTPVREEIRSGLQGLYQQDATFLLLRLVRASSESLWSVLNFIDCASDQLNKDVKANIDNPHLFHASRHLEHVCASLVDKFDPFSATLFELADKEYIEFVGSTRMAWRTSAVQNRDLLARLKQRCDEAKGLTRLYTHHVATLRRQSKKKLERTMGAMGLVLAVFSPLAWITCIYGMNFGQPDGRPGMPELIYGWAWLVPGNDSLGFAKTGPLTGYEYFWLLCGCIVMLVLLLYVALGLISVPVPKCGTSRA